MSFENLEDVVKFAIEKEKEAADFYESVARKEALSGLKEMLIEFAGQERKHQAMLEGFLTKGVAEEVKEYKLKWIPDMKRSNYIVEMEYEEGMGYADILRIAMKREEAALALYNELLTNVGTPDTKKMFQVLCQEEARHKLGLETAYDEHMAGMGD